jgi:Tol biopolymer transport system component
MSAVRCSACGAELPAGSSQKLCPVCLLKLGLSDPNVSVPAATAVRPEPEQKAAVHRRGFSPAIIVLAAAAVLLAAFAFFFLSRRPVAAPGRVVRFGLNTPRQVTDFAISPDGLRLVFSAVNDEGTTILWMHSFDSLDEQSIPGTENAATPFWSPDSRFVGFFAERKLKVFDLSDLVPHVICDAPSPGGGSWNADGTIVFAVSRPGIIQRVRANGGTPQQITSIDPSHPQRARSPHFLPDGKHFLYSAVGPNSENDGIFLGALDSKEVRHLTTGHSAAYANGALLLIRGDALVAKPFDPARLQFTGDESRIRFADRVDNFSVSQNGMLVYSNREPEDTRLAFIDRMGKRLQQIDDVKGAKQFSLSPDAKTLALSMRGDIWLAGLSRGVNSRFTFNPAEDRSPVWAPDVTRIAFLSDRSGASGIYQKPINSEMEELLLNTRGMHVESIDDWSADGRWIIYTAIDEKGKSNLWVLPVTGERKPTLIPFSFNMRQGRFSPDVRWLAYVSDESGKDEIYVQTFPDRESKWQVSVHGGDNPRWRRDGREIFYEALDNNLMSVPVSVNARQVFQLGSASVLLNLLSHNSYDVTPDGQRFLVSVHSEARPSTSLNVVVNWAEKF